MDHETPERVMEAGMERILPTAGRQGWGGERGGVDNGCRVNHVHLWGNGM